MINSIQFNKVFLKVFLSITLRYFLNYKTFNHSDLVTYKQNNISWNLNYKTRNTRKIIITCNYGDIIATKLNLHILEIELPFLHSPWEIPK